MPEPGAILIVEDEADLLFLLRQNFAQHPARERLRGEADDLHLRMGGQDTQQFASRVSGGARNSNAQHPSAILYRAGFSPPSPGRAPVLSFGELEAGARAFLTILFSFFDARIACQETGALQ